MTRPVIERFEEKYQEEPMSGCWIWTAATNFLGYGVFGYKGGDRAHRFSYEHHKGPLGDLQCLHTCDNPCCVNPDHLYAGTHADNMRDKAIRERVCGERHPNSKLTNKNVKEIMGLRGVLSGPKTGLKFNVKTTIIYNIWHGRAWKHLDRTIQ